MININSRVFIAGHKGMLGSSIFRILKKKGYKRIITIEENRANYYQSNPDFIQQYIFPGGMLPTKAQLETSAKEVGLKCLELLSFGKSYAKTLNIWNSQFQDSWNDVSRFGFDSNFKRMWEFYFSYCETGFLSSSIDVSHFLIKK